MDHGSFLRDFFYDAISIYDAVYTYFILLPFYSIIRPSACDFGLYPLPCCTAKVDTPASSCLGDSKSEHTMHQTHGRRLADLTPLHFDTDILYLSYILPLPYLFVLRRSTELDVFVFISIHMAYLSTSVYMDGGTTAGSQIDQRATWFSEFFFST